MNPIIHWIGSWKGPVPDLDVLEKREKISCQHKWRTEGGGVGPPPEIPRGFQNHAKLNLIVKTVKNSWIQDAKHPKMFGKKAVKF